MEDPPSSGTQTSQCCPGGWEPEPGPSMVALVLLALGTSSAVTQPCSGLVTLLPMGCDLGRRHSCEGKLPPCLTFQVQGAKPTQRYQPLSSQGRGI